jgi:rhodanese-related sulfurtransferase
MNKILTGLIKKAQDYGDLPSLSPVDAYELLNTEPNAIIIDVRTKAELDWIGKPLIKAEQYAHIEWLLYPGSAQNPFFAKSLDFYNKNTILLFLCRSGIRSKMAVRTALDHGFEIAIDILDGFEGQRNSKGHRKSIDGWCHDGLPWIGA